MEGMKISFRTHRAFMILFSIFFISGVYTREAHAYKAIFRPKDLLPLLPRQVSWPILKSLNNAAGLMPSFIGAATAGNTPQLQWKGACFYNNTAWLEFNNKSESKFGGGTLHIKVIGCSFDLIFKG